jgi:predicted nuclease with TOPRIM domain
MIESESTIIAQWAVALVIGLAGVAYGFQKLVKSWKATDAESSIISIMHTELERMAAQNTILAEELNKLQIEIIKLTKELHNLSIENQRLNTEIASLTQEVSRLQHMLAKGT